MEDRSGDGRRGVADPSPAQDEKEKEEKIENREYY